MMVEVGRKMLLMIVVGLISALIIIWVVHPLISGIMTIGVLLSTALLIAGEELFDIISGLIGL